MRRRYRAKVGLNWGPNLEQRLEAGETSANIPEESVPWLLEQDLIEPVGSMFAGEDEED